MKFRVCPQCGEQRVNKKGDYEECGASKEELDIYDNYVGYDWGD